jgi:hypothetical protein
LLAKRGVTTETVEQDKRLTRKDINKAVRLDINKGRAKQYLKKFKKSSKVFVVQKSILNLNIQNNH